VRPLESVPNFSEGRNRETIDAIGEALGEHARLLDVHADEDHNRSGFTIVGDEVALTSALVAGVRTAKERIDLRRHEGAHPRIGATDVVPIVPLVADELERAVACARGVSERIAAELALPVFHYGSLASGLGPAFFRRGGPEGLQRRIEAGELEPDAGPKRLDERAGGVLVGARRPLIAFNVNLTGGGIEVARAIAAIVRESGGGFPGVRALGLDLPRAGVTQVSMNVEDWEASALHEIVARVEAEARARGAEVADTELVGLMPAGAAAAAAGAMLSIRGFDASRVLEVRLLEE
jgi:glutamate formiminotransferase / 5-formyltetrahydrofolate cyclo-ligase